MADERRRAAVAQMVIVFNTDLRYIREIPFYFGHLIYILPAAHGHRRVWSTLTLALPYSLLINIAALEIPGRKKIINM